MLLLPKLLRHRYIFEDKGELFLLRAVGIPISLIPTFFALKRQDFPTLVPSLQLHTCPDGETITAADRWEYVSLSRQLPQRVRNR